MAESALEIMQSALIKCGKQLFSFYSSIPETQMVVEDARMPDCPEETLYCSSIGLTGDQFELSAVILATSNTVASLCPIPDISTDDWIGELANQLMGRFKNALIEYGHAGKLSLPVTASGSGLSMWDETDSPISLCIDTTVGRVILRLRAEVDASSVWIANECEAIAAEGTVCLL